MGTSFYKGSVKDCGENYVSFNKGNYMYYKIDIPKKGTYDISAYIAVGGDDESKTVPLTWKFSEIGTASSINVPYTGGYGKYEPFSLGSIYLTKGTHSLWLKNNTGGCHVQKIVIK